MKAQASGFSAEQRRKRLAEKSHRAPRSSRGYDRGSCLVCATRVLEEDERMDTPRGDVLHAACGLYRPRGAAA